MEIREIVEYTTSAYESVRALIRELNPNSSVTEEGVRQVVEDQNMHLYAVVTDNVIVGCATLCICHTPETVIGFVEAVVVSEAYRGQHLGRMLMERLIADARLFGARHLHLTSNPKRESANGLYRALGFEKKETNVYRLKIDRIEVKILAREDN